MLRSEALTFNHVTGQEKQLRDIKQKNNPQDMEGNEELKTLLENTQWTAQMIICQRCKMNLQHCCSSETFTERQFLAPRTVSLIAEELTKPHSRSILFRTSFTCILLYWIYSDFMQMKTFEVSDSTLGYWTTISCSLFIHYHRSTSIQILQSSELHAR